MTDDRAAQFALYAVMLILPLSALVARRLPLKPVLKMALAWVAIFAVGLLIASQRDRLSGLKTMFADQQVSGTETRIHMADDGHFWADVDIDGVRRRMLIDSGATTTALSSATAKAASLDSDESPFPAIIETANGTVSARTATAKSVTIGTVTATNLGIVTSPAFGETDVIGMNFLSRLGSWRVENATLVLTPNKQ
ncbi:aspartyl protease family protein [Sphingomonas sp. PP-CE-3A-406]|uniref:retropepsin-like aspartic protease family protein n=1 Tax=Sphingomonas sp. PP-CE-3A-406 TaxID=2135659 RepID=UPI000EF85DFB|nr:TIGR02281 family clan AA aspartic protease [Sphingomonas sp. PP-CE-3A-406]RMB55159.1 aspartyl protease family protein [Sphingomonas sp. PP-CE-3A-406]